ncbi:MAG: TolC family protein [Bacteroidetes bacterium]|nr:TolC family protein [Bacteroidota bacterium]
MDRNARVSEILSLREDYNTAMAALNRLMGKNEFSNLILTDSIIINYNPVYDDLRKSTMSNNKELFLDMKNVEINSSVVKEIQSQRLPVLDLNLSYNYSKVKNEVGQSLLNENDGFTRGLTLSWNIFNGFNTGREINNAKLNKLSADLTLADTRSRIDHELYVAFKKFESDKEILALEESNLDFAKENVTVALEAYRLGSISGLQLKEAQNSFETAFSRLVEARYQAKLSETELMRLNGELVK